MIASIILSGKQRGDVSRNFSDPSMEHHCDQRQCPIGLRRRMRSVPRGFSLMEMMTALAIAGVVAALALPSYSDHATRGKIAEATATLAELRTLAELHFQRHRSYRDLALPALPSARYFSYGLTVGDTTFTITATGVASEGMGGFGYAVSQGNARVTTALPAGWSGVNSNCFVLAKSGSC